MVTLQPKLGGGDLPATVVLALTLLALLDLLAPSATVLRCAGLSVLHIGVVICAMHGKG